MKIYNFNNKKLYESDNLYQISIESHDPDGNIIEDETGVYEDTYATIADAIDSIYDEVTAYAQKRNFDDGEVGFDDDEEKGVVIVTYPDGCVDEYTIAASNNEEEIVECGDITESDNDVNDPYKGNSTSTADVNDGSKPVFTRKSAETAWGWGEMPSDILELKMDPAKAYSYFNDNMLDILVESVPTDQGKVYPEALENIMYALVKLFTYNDVVDVRRVRMAIMNLVYRLKIDIHNPIYKGVIEGIDSLRESLDEDTDVNESVSARFARLRKMFESEDESDDESNDEKEPDDNKSDEDEENKEDDSDKNDDEDELMKAVIITVKKGDEEKCKEEMIDAGIAEGDIEILDADDDAENVELRIDVDSIMELKDYLEKKGIDLEKEIGGEIVADDDEDDDEKSDDESDEDDENNGDEDDFDFDNLGDLFAEEDDNK